jgi:type III secretion system HrpB7-like protein
MADANRLRISALAYANARRTRTVDALRGELAALHDERNELLARRSAKVEQIDGESRVIGGYEERVAHMTASSDGFSIDVFNQCVRYISVVTDRLRGMVAELAQLDGEIARVEQVIARIQSDIAINTQRIDQFGQRIVAIRRVIDLAREDAQDEETEEMATSRFIWARAVLG